MNNQYLTVARPQAHPRRIVLMAFARAVVSIEYDLKTCGLWRRALKNLQWPFYTTYTVLVASPVLLAGVTIVYLLREKMSVAIVASGSLIAASFTLIASATFIHLKEHRSTTNAGEIRNDEET